MTRWLQILAVDDSFTSIVEVVIAVVVILLALLGKVLKKGPTQEDQEAQRRRWEELRRAREEALSRAEAERKAQRPSQQEFQPQARAQPPGRLAPARPPAAHRPPPLPRPPMPGSQPQVGALRPSPQAAAAGVQEELHRQAERLAQEDRQRKTRMAPPPHVEPSRGVAGVEAVVGSHVDAYALKPAPAQPETLIEHLDPQQARMAIIYHEILSPPKALRHEPDSWEL